MLSTDKLKNKEVINIHDGRSLGFIYDIEVNLENGTIDGIVIPAEKGKYVRKWGKNGQPGKDGLCHVWKVFLLCA